MDTLTETKADSRVVGIILANVHIVERLELFVDKVHCDKMEYSYQEAEKRKAKIARVGKGCESGVRRISQDTSNTYGLSIGIAKNISAGMPKC